MSGAVCFYLSAVIELKLVKNNKSSKEKDTDFQFFMN